VRPSVFRRAVSRTASPYYTGVGYKNVGNVARELVEKHIDLCIDAGINTRASTAGGAKGQWEFQIFGKGSKNAADQMWVARYILARLCESYCVDMMALQTHPWAFNAPLDWNGSGMHTISRPSSSGKRRHGLLRKTHGGIPE